MIVIRIIADTADAPYVSMYLYAHLLKFSKRDRTCDAQGRSHPSREYSAAGPCSFIAIDDACGVISMGRSRTVHYRGIVLRLGVGVDDVAVEAVFLLLEDHLVRFFTRSRPRVPAGSPSCHEASRELLVGSNAFGKSLDIYSDSLAVRLAVDLKR